MKIFRYFGYAVGILGLMLVLLIGVSMLVPQKGDTSGLITSMSSDGKTVHLMRNGPGDIKFSAKFEGRGIIVNGVTFDLSGGSVFEVLLSADGTARLRK